MASRSWQPLEREEVLKAIERRRPRRVPMILAKWWGLGLGEQYGERLAQFDRFPNDSHLFLIEMCNPARMNLSWELKQTGGIDSHCVIDDWAKLDEYIEKLPVPDRDDGLARTAEAVNSIYTQGVHVHFGWWNLFFEKPWTIRGMESLLMDYHEHPEEVHRLHDALCNTYCAYIDWAARNVRFDGFWTSDDLGHQHALAVVGPVGHEHGLGHGGGAVVHGSVGHLQPGEERHHALVLEDGLESPLADFRLVRRVGREELPALQQRVAQGCHARVLEHPQVEHAVGVDDDLAAHRCGRAQCHFAI